MNPSKEFLDALTRLVQAGELVSVKIWDSTVVIKIEAHPGVRPPPDATATPSEPATPPVSPPAPPPPSTPQPSVNDHAPRSRNHGEASAARLEELADLAARGEPLFGRNDRA
jgi:hypothetical protein